ncbi:MAG: preprotein translocase subunit SecE [Phycisphaera sp.]|nr:preprotein translocase subunit SecE [Phycisphaera sp.]
MIATEAEMKKVNWPTKREVMGSTWIVICGTVMMAVLLLVVDLAFAEGFVRMHVLEGNPPVTEFFKNLFGG